MGLFGGCRYFPQVDSSWMYLPQVFLKAHAAVLFSAARTALMQTFFNPSKDLLKEVSYAFPLYDGVSVIDFTLPCG